MAVVMLVSSLILKQKSTYYGSGNVGLFPYLKTDARLLWQWWCWALPLSQNRSSTIMAVVMLGSSLISKQKSTYYGSGDVGLFPYLKTEVYLLWHWWCWTLPLPHNRSPPIMAVVMLGNGTLPLPHNRNPPTMSLMILGVGTLLSYLITETPYYGSGDVGRWDPSLTS